MSVVGKGRYKSTTEVKALPDHLSRVATPWAVCVAQGPKGVKNKK